MEKIAAQPSVLERWQKIQSEVGTALKSSGRLPGSARLIAVSKTHPFEAIRPLYEAGQRDFGENYVQELQEKAAAARAAGFSDIRWHFIGHLQTNKVKALLPHIYAIHGVNSMKLAAEISKRAERTTPVFLEVNIDAEESKSGIQISDLRKIAEKTATLPKLKILGLMCIPDPSRPEGSHAAFRRLSELEKSLRPLTNGELSMGMTSDFGDAIREGATWIRIGTAIFGKRSPREKL